MGLKYNALGSARGRFQVAGNERQAMNDRPSNVAVHVEPVKGGRQ